MWMHAWLHNPHLQAAISADGNLVTSSGRQWPMRSALAELQRPRRPLHASQSVLIYAVCLDWVTEKHDLPLDTALEYRRHTATTQHVEA